MEFLEEAELDLACIRGLVKRLRPRVRKWREEGGWESMVSEIEVGHFCYVHFIKNPLNITNIKILKYYNLNNGPAIVQWKGHTWR